MSTTSPPLDAPRIFTPEYYRRMWELEDGAWWNAGMRDAAALLLAALPLPKQGVVLDVGCGTGQTMAWLERLRPGWRAVGFDVAMDGLAAARTLGMPHVMCASATTFPVRSESVDLVVMLDVLQHLPLATGDREALSEIARVLKPGGYFFLRTNAQSFPRVADDPEHMWRRYTVPQLRERFERAGLEVVRLSRLNALLGLAELPRELRTRHQGSYRGILSEARAEPAWSKSLKRTWLGLEARAVRHGVPLPFGRTIVAICRRRAPGGEPS